MKKLVVALLILGSVSLSHSSAAQAQDSNPEIQALKEKVVVALVQVFEGTLDPSDAQLEDLKSQASSLPIDDITANEIRAALDAVMPS